MSVHESLIKESNLDKMVTQFQELSGNVEEMRSDLGFIGEALSGGGGDEDEDDLERELEDFLKDDADQIADPEMTRPQEQTITKDFVVGLPQVPIGKTPSVESYFEIREPKKKIIAAD